MWIEFATLFLYTNGKKKKKKKKLIKLSIFDSLNAYNEWDNEINIIESLHFYCSVQLLNKWEFKQFFCCLGKRNTNTEKWLKSNLLQMQSHNKQDSNTQPHRATLITDFLFAYFLLLLLVVVLRLLLFAVYLLLLLFLLFNFFFVCVEVQTARFAIAHCPRTHSYTLSMWEKRVQIQNDSWCVVNWSSREKVGKSEWDREKEWIYTWHKFFSNWAFKYNCTSSKCTGIPFIRLYSMRSTLSFECAFFFDKKWFSCFLFIFLMLDVIWKDEMRARAKGIKRFQSH